MIAEVKLSKEETNEIFNDSYSNEFKYAQKFGSDARAALSQMAESTTIVHSDKLGKDLSLECSIVREQKNNGGLVSFGPTYYRIQAKDGETILGKCTYRLDSFGVHLGFIGLSEDLDKSYQGTGIGSMLFARLEELSRALGATYIEGQYTPIGKFASSTKNFYERNGFSFEVDYEDHGKTFVRKNLEPAKEEIKQTGLENRG